MLQLSGAKRLPRLWGSGTAGRNMRAYFFLFSPWHAGDKGIDQGRLAEWILRDLQTFLNLIFRTEQWPEQKGISSMRLDLSPAGSCQGLPLALPPSMWGAKAAEISQGVVKKRQEGSCSSANKAGLAFISFIGHIYLATQPKFHGPFY